MVLVNDYNPEVIIVSSTHRNCEVRSGAFGERERKKKRRERRTDRQTDRVIPVLFIYNTVVCFFPRPVPKEAFREGEILDIPPPPLSLSLSLPLPPSLPSISLSILYDTQTYYAHTDSSSLYLYVCICLCIGGRPHRDPLIHCYLN